MLERLRPIQHAMHISTTLLYLDTLEVHPTLSSSAHQPAQVSRLTEHLPNLCNQAVVAQEALSYQRMQEALMSMLSL